MQALAVLSATVLLAPALSAQWDSTDRDPGQPVIADASEPAFPPGGPMLPALAPLLAVLSLSPRPWRAGGGTVDVPGDALANALDDTIGTY